jgi:hypothetical protein
VDVDRHSDGYSYGYGYGYGNGYGYYDEEIKVQPGILKRIFKS